MPVSDIQPEHDATTDTDSADRIAATQVAWPGTSISQTPPPEILDVACAADPAGPGEHSAPDLVSANDRRFMRWLLSVFLVGLTAEWIWIASRRPNAIEIQHSERFHQLYSVEINSATWVEWMQLEGIGQTMAHRIVADRRINGPFHSIDDLERVSGIGPKTIERLRPWLRFETQAPAEESSTPKARPSGVAQQP